MIFDNQMEKIFMIGLFPSCVYVLWIFSTTYMNYLHPSMCIICTKKRSLLHILSALDCQKTRIKAAWPRRSINGLHRIPNRAWRIDGIYASMYMAIADARSIFVFFIFQTTVLHFVHGGCCKSEIPLLWSNSTLVAIATSY